MSSNGNETNKIILRKYVSGTVYDLINFSKKQICCVSPRRFNDPVDTYFYYSSAECFSKSKKILTREIMDRIRICCFSNHSKILESRNKNKITSSEILKSQNMNKITSSEILMWTHYANAHNGFCFEYHVPVANFSYLNSEKFDDRKLLLDKIVYVEDLATEFEEWFSKEQDEGYTVDKFEDLLKTCFFTKDDSFKYENEFRLLKYADKSDENDYIPLKFDFLRKIIFGKRCHSDVKYLVNCINRQIYDGSIELININDQFREVDYNEK